jgi:hypothetical protein
MADEIAKIQEEINPVVAQAGTMMVTTGAEYEGAAAFLKQVKAAMKKVDATVLQPLRESKAKIDETRRNFETILYAPLEQAEKTIKKKMEVFTAEQERIRQEAERVAREAQAREAARLAKLQAEAEARTRAAEQTAREAEARAAAAIAAGNAAAARAAEQERKAAAAKAAADAAKAEAFAARQQVVEAAPVMVASTVPTVAGIANTKRWTFEVVDEMAVPRTYLMLDTVKIGKMVTAGKGTMPIPGIRQFQVAGMSSR